MRSDNAPPHRNRSKLRCEALVSRHTDLEPVGLEDRGAWISLEHPNSWEEGVAGEVPGGGEDEQRDSVTSDSPIVAAE